LRGKHPKNSPFVKGVAGDSPLKEGNVPSPQWGEDEGEGEKKTSPIT